MHAENAEAPAFLGALVRAACARRARFAELGLRDHDNAKA
jgi:hypothetical protein